MRELGLLIKLSRAEAAAEIEIRIYYCIVISRGDPSNLRPHGVEKNGRHFQSAEAFYGSAN